MKNHCYLRAVKGKRLYNPVIIFLTTVSTADNIVIGESFHRWTIVKINRLILLNYTFGGCALEYDSFWCFAKLNDIVRHISSITWVTSKQGI